MNEELFDELKRYIQKQNEMNERVASLLALMEERMRRVEQFVFMNSPIGPVPRPFDFVPPETPWVPVLRCPECGGTMKPGHICTTSEIG
jgi:hypothetical protein